MNVTNIIKHKKAIAYLLAFTPLFFSCAEDLSDGNQGNDDAISFSVRTEALTEGTRAYSDAVSRLTRTSALPQLYIHQQTVPEQSGSKSSMSTRGAIVTSNNLSSFRWYGFYKDGNTTGSLTSSTGTASRNSDYKTDTRWTSHSSYKFYAVSPVSNSDEGISIGSDGTYDNVPTITYTPPADVRYQPDVLFASQETTTGSGSVPLTFRHITTAIRFAVDDLPVGTTITRITLSGITSTGSYNGSWTQGTGTASYAVEPGFTWDGDSKNIYITSEVMFLIPQTLPDGATITVNLTTKDGQQHTLTGSLAGRTWTQGTTVTYKISSSAIKEHYVFSADVTNNAIKNFPHEGGTLPINVTSYMYTGSDNTKNNSNVGWVAEFSTDGGATWMQDAPAGLTGLTGVEVPTAATTTITATIPAQEPAYNGMTHSARFNSVTNSNPNGFGNAYDLSLCDYAGNVGTNANQRNTANCYVVRHPGYYRIPIVYGNTIRNGADNIHASDNYVNADGEQITSPVIANNGADWQNAQAVVQWQDVPDLVTVRYIHPTASTGMCYIYVTVGNLPTGVTGGNAVIALRTDNGQGSCIWAWHLWMTDVDISNTIKVNYASDNRTARMMPVNLGWVPSEDAISEYLNRSTIIRLRQKDGGDTIRFTLRQPQEEVNRSGRSTYYQWGRKDPFSPVWNVLAATAPASNGIAEAIKNPWFAYYGGTYGWQNSTATGLWHTGIRNNRKTVYDPSPIGFRVPVHNVFTYLSRDGSIYTFFCNTAKDSTIYMPPTGQWQLADSATYTLSNTAEGHYWTNDQPNNDANGYAIDFTESTVDAHKGEIKSSLFAVRPERE